MGRNRKPKAVAERDGSFEKHPERRANYGNEPKPSGSLGGPPAQWLPPARSEEAAALFAAGKDTYAVAGELGMTFEQARGLRPGAPAPEERLLLDAWNDIVGQAPPGVLTISDRLWVEMTCYALVRVRQRKEKSSDRNSVKDFLGKMAMNPADRSKVQLSTGGGASAPNPLNAPQKANPFAELAEEDRERIAESRPN